jgi:nucleotide-binding universal stress UspA family protein
MRPAVPATISSAFCPEKGDAMTALREYLRHARPAAAKPPTGGPVIACIDDGPPGVGSARIGGSLARGLGTRLLLATVHQPTPDLPSTGDLAPEPARHARRLLVRAATELDAPAELYVGSGEPAEQLIALAQRESAELIVVGAPDRSRIRTRLLGSVYLALAGTGPCPVVVVPPDVEDATTGPIVCGVDGSAGSTTAARVAADLAGRLETELLLVHSDDGAARWTCRDSPARILQEAAEELRAATPNYLLVERGPPAERLAQVAERERARILVTGSRGRARIDSVLLGSVASEIATSATRPLMIVPPRV